MNERARVEHEPIPPQTSGSFLPPDFQVRELSIGQGISETKDQEFSFDHDSMKLKGRFSYQTVGLQPNRLLLAFDAYLDDQEVISFNSDLDNAEWSITRRVISKDFRRQGLARREIQTLEDLQDKLAARYPNLKFTSTAISTKLGVLAKLIIDQNYLVEHGLERFSTQQNLGYIPVKKNYGQEPTSTEITALLKAGKKEISEARAETREDDTFTFVKPNSNYHE